MKALSYKTVDSFLVASMPEFSAQYEELRKRHGEQPGQYIVFGALNSMVVQALEREEDRLFLARVFDAFEKMAMSNDIEVVNLLQVGFLENLVSYPGRLARAWQLMGSATRKLTRDTARIWNREANIPASR